MAEGSLRDAACLDQEDSTVEIGRPCEASREGDAGRNIVTRSPQPGRPANRMSPPWERTIERATARPSPVPPVSRLRRHPRLARLLKRPRRSRSLPSWRFAVYGPEMTSGLDDDRRFAALAAAACRALEEKQERLGAEYRLGTFARWHYDQDTALLRFFDEAGRVRLIADFIDIGSFSRKSETWRWAWSNDSVPLMMRQKAYRLRELCAATGQAIFHREDAFKIEEAKAWELAAIAVMHLGAVGCYRAPASDCGLYVFLALTDIRTVN